jgi:ABC-type multidrug transport system ATPase subunit
VVPTNLGSVAPAPAVAADDVWRSYGRLRVLRGATLDVPAGSAVAILGPNGAGKSTLLRVLAASLRPHRGRVRVHGRDPWSDPAARRALGFVGHDPMLYGGLSAFENLRLFAALYGVADPRERAAWACDLVGLTRRDDPIRALSRGLVQRAALARALAHGPTVLLLDEALSGLDPDAAARLSAFLDDFRAQGGSIVLTTHQVGEALRVADRAHVLVQGRLGPAHALAGVDATALEAWYREAAGTEPQR